MARSKTTKPFRRLATLTAAVGMLVMSSGVALIVTSPSADAVANKVNICHATSSDKNPYVFIQVDDDSVKLKGHLKHRSAPVHHWQNAGTFNGVAHLAGAKKADLIGSFTDSKGVFHQYDGNITEASCVDTTIPEADVAVAEVSYTDPTCENENLATFEGTGDFVTFALKSGTNTPGDTVVVEATATGTAKFEDGTTVMDFPPHTYGDALDLEGEPCVDAVPPVVVPNPPVVIPPTVVHAGLVTVPSSVTNEQGLALLFGGLVLMLAAGGLGLTGSIRRARS